MKTSEFLTSLVTPTDTVTVQGKEITLNRPDISKAVEVHEASIPKDGETQQQVIERNIRVCALALNACLDEDDQLADAVAEQVIFASGGIGGELSKAALKLCGLDIDAKKVPDRPTT